MTRVPPVRTSRCFVFDGQDDLTNKNVILEEEVTSSPLKVRFLEIQDYEFLVKEGPSGDPHRGRRQD